MLALRKLRAKWIRERLKIFGRISQDIGTAAALLWAFDRMVAKHFSLQIVAIPLFDIFDCLSDHAQLPTGYTMSVGDRQTLTAIANEHPELMSLHFLEEALAKGDECFVIRHEGELAAFQWYSDGPTEMFNGIYLKPPGDRRYCYKGNVLPAFRSQRLHSLGKRVAAKRFCMARPVGLVSFVMIFNHASLLSASKIPGQRFGYALLWRWKHHLWSISSTACRLAEIRFSLRQESTLNNPSITSHSRS